jgi:hypothetical protein
MRQEKDENDEESPYSAAQAELAAESAECVCEVIETRLEAVEIVAIDGYPVPPREELRRDVLPSAQAALRKAVGDHHHCEVTCGGRCPPGWYCVVSEKEKRRKDGWKDAGTVEIEAEFTFPGATSSHVVRGAGRKQVRFLSGTCCRNEIIRGKG